MSRGVLMLFFDSHCHLDDNVFTIDFDEVVARAINEKVLAMILVGIDELTSSRAKKLASVHDSMYASVGFHPHNASRCEVDALERLVELSKCSKVVAWGEVGLDFNRAYSDQKQQEDCFVRQLELAIGLKLPIILHERDTEGRLIEILSTYPQISHAVIHCFSGNRYEMEKYLERGFHIGVTGIISMSKRGKQLRDLVKCIPADRLLVETDSPYLTPVPHRNNVKRNEPAFVSSILMKLADVRQEDPFVLAKQVWNNTCAFFRVNPYRTC